MRSNSPGGPASPRLTHPHEYRRRIQPGGLYHPVAHRYVLYASDASPISCVCLAYLEIKQLRHAIQVGLASPRLRRCVYCLEHDAKREEGHSSRGDEIQRAAPGWLEPSQSSSTPPLPSSNSCSVQLSAPCNCGWCFDASDGIHGDPLKRFSTVAEIYRLSRDVLNAAPENASSSFSPTPFMECALPLLFDTHTNTIINNSATDIAEMLNGSFHELAKAPEINLEPRFLSSLVKSTNQRLVYPMVQVIRACGSATSQAAYTAAAESMAMLLTGLEADLGKRRYLCSSKLITDSDIRLACLLVLLDDIYAVCCRCTHCFLRVRFPNIIEWLRDVVQTFSLMKVINIDAAREYYFLSYVNPLGPGGNVRIAPLDTGFTETLLVPHQRGDMMDVSTGIPLIPQ